MFQVDALCVPHVPLAFPFVYVIILRIAVTLNGVFMLESRTVRYYETACRVVPVLGGFAILATVFYSQYLYKMQESKHFHGRCPLDNGLSSSPSCNPTDIMGEVWVPALMRTLLFMLLVATVLSMVAVGLYLAFSTANRESKFQRMNATTTKLAPVISTYGSMFAVSIMLLLVWVTGTMQQ